ESRHAALRPGRRARPRDEARRGLPRDRSQRPARPRRVPRRMTLLRLDGVVAGYGRGDVLTGIDLTLEHGAVTCLVGPNGAGQSPVLKTLSGLLRPRSGRILLDGEDIGRCSPAQVLARGVVHVTQERSLFPLMTIWDNLLIGGHILADRALVHRRAEAI